VRDKTSDSDAGDKGELFSTSRDKEDRMTVVDVPISRPTDASGKQRPQGLGIEASISFHSISFFACQKNVLRDKIGCLASARAPLAAVANDCATATHTRALLSDRKDGCGSTLPCLSSAGIVHATLGWWPWFCW
jgi:hypothetical protein